MNLPLLSLLLLFFSIIPISSSQASINNPFSPQASLLRFWSRLFSTTHPPPSLLTKSSPLNATQLAIFSHYIDSHSLPSHILSFCSLANLFCDLRSSSSSSSSKATHNISNDTDFQNYSNKQFQNYRRGGVYGGDDFKNYSIGENVARDSFLNYGKDGTSRYEDFSFYALDTNVAGSAFGNYHSNAHDGSTQFGEYGSNSNIQRHDFANYARDTSGTLETFSSYSDNSNVVMNRFKTYGTDANALTSLFSSYSEKSNVIMNNFKNYNEGGNGPFDQFSTYGSNGNVVRDDFTAYGKDGNGDFEVFTSYGDSASESLNRFRSYGKDTNGGLNQFRNYGNTTFPSKNEFVEYGKDGDENSQFAEYFGNDTSFKEYSKTPPSFSDYFNGTRAQSSGFPVEAGKFFREANLTKGRRISIPDIRDKMPQRKFLPKALAKKLPFSSSRLTELVGMLAANNLEAVMAKTVSECERPAVKDERKKCVTSIEEMAEFAVSVIGKGAEVSTTASVGGWGKVAVVGKVVGRNGGEVTKSVSCHQSLFPYMVYYCHAVPKVRVYDVELMDESGKKKVNDGVAICHLDTSQWSGAHAAFVALGPGPGKIEVCHWIFENDLIWVGHL